VTLVDSEITFRTLSPSVGSLSAEPPLWLLVVSSVVKVVGHDALGVTFPVPEFRVRNACRVRHAVIGYCRVRERESIQAPRKLQSSHRSESERASEREGE